MAFAVAAASVVAPAAAPHARCTCARRRPRLAALDAPVKDDVRTRLNRLLTLTPTAEPLTDPERVKSRIDPGKEYKVMLINDEANSKEYVVRVLTRCIPGLSKEAAYSIMNKAHTDGAAVVGVWSAEIAEGYADLLRNNGLRADISPA